MTARRLTVISAVAVLAVVGPVAIAAARPGGGDSYSGGGGHGGGGGSSGGGAVIFELIYWLFRIVFAYPAIGLPLLALVIGYVIYNARRQHHSADWDSGPAQTAHDAIDSSADSVDLADLRRIDPAFSQVVFEDFAFRLFSTAQRARHAAEALATVAPYVGEAARAELAARPPAGQPVVQAIVGAMRTYRVELPDDGRAEPAPRVRIGIEYEANVATADHTYYSVESWLFGRAAAVTSKPPGATRTFPCPHCGAPWQAANTTTQVCASCGEAVDNGRFDWVVEQISLTSCDERPPTLTTEVAERGTDLPTYHHPGVDAAWQALLRDDPAISEPALRARLEMIYTQLNLAWTQLDLRPARGLVSDGLYDYLSYWVAAYRSQRLRNVLADMRITHTEIAKLTRDRYFDALTIRIWATGKDYVVRDPGGEHVRGARHRERAYSEYWTLIRTAQRKAAPITTPACSNCGAPLQITQSGECEHCGAHVTAGEFDWVVSKVEQDDSYRG
jgi:predicted lipid-binding transport protein (Tim44 family)/ribosomal protein L37E